MNARMIAFIAAGLLAAPAWGQDTDQLQMSNQRARGQEAPATSESLRANYAYANCVLRSTRLSTDILDTVPGSVREQRSAFWGVMGSNSCNGSGRIPPATRPAMRGMVAELLLARDFDLAAGTSRSGPARRFDMPAGQAFSRLAPDAQASLLLIQFGECVARADRAGLARLFATAAGTPEERSAFIAIRPALGGCIPQGASFAIQPRSMRGYLAEGAYRVLAAAPPAARN
jgi:hypothetical protein